MTKMKQNTDTEMKKRGDSKQELHISDANSENYLLILPCSKRKKDLAIGRAIEIYDGPFYQILRKYNKENVDVLILSAKYGLLEGSDIISPYELKMTPEIAKRLKATTQYRLRTYLRAKNYNRILINLGKTYRSVIDECNFQANNGVKPEFLEGTIGLRNNRLKKWLREI